MSSLRPGIVLAVFLIGLAGGAAIFGTLRQATPSSPYPAVAGAPQPRVTASLADAIEANDAHALAGSLGSDTLTKLAEALEPIVEVSEVDFVGAIAKGDDTLAGYVARGIDQSGAKVIVGFVLHVQGNSVVGVN